MYRGVATGDVSVVVIPSDSNVRKRSDRELKRILRTAMSSS